VNAVSPDARQSLSRILGATIRASAGAGLAALAVSLALLTAPRTARAAGPMPLEEKPTPTIKVCHMCDDEVAATATPTLPAVCFECDAVHPVRLTALAPSPTSTPGARSPVVHLAMFWMQGCPACEEVIQHVLPPLKAEHGSHLDVLLVELTTQEDVDQLFALAADLGVQQEQIGVPFLIIGDRVLIGSAQVSGELPDLIVTYLTHGGIDLMDHPVLASELTRAIAFDPGPAAGEPRTPDRPQGFVLATVVLVAMMMALMYAIASVFFPRLPIPQGRWVDHAVPWLAALGLVVVGYLAYVETRAISAICGPVGDCNVVQTSAYARLFGVLPVSFLGAFAYLLFLATWAVERRAAARVAIWAGLGSFLLALVGTAFSMYLTFLEPFVIRAVCLWCLTSALAMALLLLLSVKAPRAWRLLQTKVRQ